METEKTLGQVEARLAGQITALGVALHVMLRSHPEREQMAADIHEALETLIARGLGSPLRDELMRGMQVARDLYLLKPVDDPGQPKR